MAGSVIGDCLNIAILLHTAAYLLTVGGHHYKFINALSPAVAQDGFCVSNKEQSVYMQSHALCLYGDTVFTVLLFLIVKMDRSDQAAPAVAMIRPQLFAIFFHGCAHMFVGHKFENATPEWMALSPCARQTTAQGRILYCAFLCCFWFGFMKSFHGLAFHTFFFTMAYGVVHFFCVPGVFAFTYVNCMLFFHSSCNALFFAEKGPYYTAQVFFSGVPLALVTWMEALLCEQVIRPIGGHLVYDLTIPISLLAFYVYVRMVEAPDKLKSA